MRKAFVDLGANLGIISERFAVQHPGFDIFCIEPNPTLIPSIVECSLRAGRPFWVMWAAAWVTDGTIDLFESGAHEASTVVPGKLEHSGWPQIDYTRSLTVPSLDISAWLKRTLTGYDEIVLKMDIEGAEYPILEKMIADRTLGLVTRLSCEWHEDRYPDIGRERHETLKSKVESLTNLEFWS